MEGVLTIFGDGIGPKQQDYSSGWFAKMSSTRESLCARSIITCPETNLVRRWPLVYVMVLGRLPQLWGEGGGATWKTVYPLLDKLDLIRGIVPVELGEHALFGTVYLVYTLSLEDTFNSGGSERRYSTPGYHLASSGTSNALGRSPKAMGLHGAPL